MKIENYNQASFRAQFLNKIKIGQSVNNGSKYIDKTVSFIKINPGNPGDIDALSIPATYWDGDKFAKNIYYVTCDMRDKSQCYKDDIVYALTTQINNFENLDGDKILGVVHTSSCDDTPMFIEHIQVNPQYLSTTSYFMEDKKPEYKGLGSAIINSLKRLEKKITCFPESDQSIKNFYIKNGFKKHPDISNYFVWKKK